MSGGRKVFVAGGTGLVGTALVRRLLADSRDVFVRASRHVTSAPLLDHPRVEYVEGDLQSLDTCREMCRGCDVAVMAAAYAGGAGFVTAFPWATIKQNLSLHLQLLEAFQLETISRIVFIGSATIYQESERSLAEEDLDRNQDPSPAYLGFGGAMRFVETICRMIHERSGTDTLVLRAANVFGPFAKFDPATSNVIPALIRKAVDKLDPFEVWGDPQVRRDVIFSEDFADAVATLALGETGGHDIFNVGYGKTTTIGELVQWVLKHANHQPRSIVYRQDRPTTRQSNALDCSKITNQLGWVPRHTVEEGIRKTTEWWVENKRTWKR
jgi:nucleoside-diphosphate-sugar epimerase